MSIHVHMYKMNKNAKALYDQTYDNYNMYVKSANLISAVIETPISDLYRL